MKTSLAIACVFWCSAAQAHAQVRGTERLDEQLRAALVEREDTTQTLPLLTLGTGIAAVAVGMTVGVLAVLGCDARCDMPTWVGPTIIAGGAVASFGTVWWVRAEREQSELDLRIARLREDLRVLGAGRAASEPRAEAQLSRARVGLRLSF
jgi:uncharacterized protein YfaQ (DUF2300 family)